MKKQIVKTDKVPLPIGPYNQAVKANGFVFCAAQIALDISTGQMTGVTVREQTRLVLTHIKNLLEASGSSLNQVVKTTVFLKDLSKFSEMNEVYTEFFKGTEPPARATVEVARLPKDALVEIEATAVIMQP